MAILVGYGNDRGALLPGLPCGL